MNFAILNVENQMLKSKLFDVLKTFDEAEYREFGDFVASPYFNKSKVLIRLCSIYRKFYPEFRNASFTKHNVYRKLLPGKEYNEGVLRNYNSDLLTLAEKFLADKNICRNNRNYYKQLLNELNLRNINKLFESNYRSALRTLENSESRDTSYHFDRYYIKQEGDVFNSLSKKFSMQDKLDSEESFINYFVSVLLEMYAFIINQSEIFKVKYEFTLFDELINLVESKKGILSPVVLIYYHRLMLNFTGLEKFYLLLKEQAVNHGSLSETENHFDTFICLINYVRKHKDMEAIENIREVFELRKIIIEKNIQTGKNYISHNIFNNQVKSGLKLKEFEWVFNFIESFKDRLLENIRHNTYEYCLAIYYYEIRNYPEALKHISLVSGGSFDLLEVKNLTARICWDMNDFDLVHDNLASYNQYISKNRKLDKNTGRKHKEFINVMESLFKCKYDGKKIDLIELKNKVQTSDIASKKWVTDSIELLQSENGLAERNPV